MKERPLKLCVICDNSQWKWAVIDRGGIALASSRTSDSEAKCRNAAQVFLALIAMPGSLDCDSYQPRTP